MHVIATAGHVDHGKSTLVRALTGMEPDRWAEERKRGMTIDLGYAWMATGSGAQLAFVDVPGHQRFIGNMLAGLGPAPAVLFVVAADEGWSRQSQEHLAAVHALRLRAGVLAVTRSDLADPAPVLADARARIARTSLGELPAVAVSGVTQSGLAELREALEQLAARLPQPDAGARVRLWVDRSFTVRGSGTVVTGTLGAGSVRVGDELELRGRRVSVRGIQSLGSARELVSGVARVALNLRGIATDEVRRGDALLTPEAWLHTRTLDVRLETDTEASLDDLPAELVLHAGTASVPARLRPLGGSIARLHVPGPLPLQIGDRALLRDPGRQVVAAGVHVLDPDPPELRRRGAAAARADQLRDADGVPNAAIETSRRRAVHRDHLQALGVPAAQLSHLAAHAADGGAGRSTAGGADSGAVAVAGWFVAEPTWAEWTSRLPDELNRWSTAHPLEPGMPVAAVRRALGLPDSALVAGLAAGSGLVCEDGRVRRPGMPVSLGAAEPSVAELENRLTAEPFAAPSRDELAALHLGRRELAAAEKAGRLLRITDDVVLLPSAPEHAVALLRSLPGPFTLSQARQLLGTSRRVAVPLMEYLDAQRFTERCNDQCRRLRDTAAKP
ncbi:MAG TPA: selenocysteine-specific translation elongation factor [Jatrophihabitans sp.]|nr:selenocysteine-specific translation elongation factor [Jatrophihabitans sp.]